MPRPNATSIEVHHDGKKYDLQEFILKLNKRKNIWIAILIILNLICLGGLGFLFYIFQNQILNLF